jgi:nucleoside phosphorylase
VIDVLIVDDDTSKAKRISEVCKQILDGYGVSVVLATNVHEAVGALKRQTFDLLILDLNLPARADSSPISDGGVRVLDQIVNRRPGVRVPHHVVGLTGFTNLADDQTKEFAKYGWLLLSYSGADDQWQDVLANRLLHLATIETTQDEFRVDLAIVTALFSVELEEVLKLDAGWKEVRLPGDSSVYYQGVFADGSGKELDVVAAASVEMGMAASCALATKVIYQFRPRFLGMAGIAAAASTKASFGDVLVATSAYDYGAGKSVVQRSGKGVFQPAPDPIQVHQWLRARLEVFRMACKDLAFLTKDWDGAKPVRAPVLRPGPFASGAAVIADRNIVRRLLRDNRKVVGVEMEVFGVFMAAKVASGSCPQVFAMKSVCDFAGKRKDDRYQLFAAHTSARCLREFAVRYLYRGAASGK